MTITYEILKYDSEWVLWKNIETTNGIGSMQVIKGSKAECQKKLEELNGNRNIKRKSIYFRKQQLSVSSKESDVRKKHAKEIEYFKKELEKKEKELNELRYKQQELF